MTVNICDICKESNSRIYGYDSEDDTIYEYNVEVQNKLGIEHICEFCLDNNKDLELQQNNNSTEFVKFK